MTVSVVEVALGDTAVDRLSGEVRRQERDCRVRHERRDGERRPAAIGAGELPERREPASGLGPRPVVDARASVLREVGARLPDLHGSASFREGAFLSGHPIPPPAASVILATARMGHDFVPIVCRCAASSGDHLLEQAVLVDLPEQRALVEQLGLGAASDDPAVVEHDDLVGEGDRGQAVGDDDRRPSAHRLAEAGSDLRLGRRVD